MEPQQDLKILHVTDLHCAYDKIEQLKEWLRQEGLKLDIVLVSGDIANIPYALCQTASEDLKKEHSEHLHQIMTDFVPLTDKVYFVPGNHDPISFFDTSAPIEEPIIYPLNVHSRKVTLAPNLHLLGFGGSVPSYQDGKLLWKGFPYETDTEFGNELAGFLDPIIEEDMVSLSETYVFMTHNGPAKSNTAEVHSPTESVIHAGSDILYEYLTKVEMEGRTALHIHGHTHDCTGMSTIGSISVVNPGALMDGHFGIYTLTMVSGRKPAWKLSCASLHRLK